MEDNKIKDQVSDPIHLLQAFVQLVQEGVEKFNKICATPEVQNLIKSFTNSMAMFANYNIHQRDMMKTMSKEGWFPSYLTFKNLINEGEMLDDYMVRCLKPKLDQVLELLIGKYPIREKIFIEAFKLLQEERYISAIPLLLTQVDGICQDAGLPPYFTGDHNISWEKKRNNPLLKKKSSKLPEFMLYALNGDFEDIDPKALKFYKEVLINASESFISDGSNRVNLDNKIEILNRHGILHGDSRFISYGNEINALKVVSLLLFVDSLSDLIDFQKDKNEDL